MRHFLLSFSFMLLPLPALAIYKCEANGKVSYSDVPCRGAQLLNMSEDSQTMLATQTAQQQLAQQKAQLKQLQSARHQRETREEKEQQKTARLAAAHEKKCKAMALRVKWSQEDAASANSRSQEKAKLKARRMTEQYKLECGKDLL
jgi:hypothetical protein